jgi:hypothetical protein
VRTGISFLSIGIALLSYYGLGPLAPVNMLLMAAGLLMAADGVQWYWPVRKEQAEVPRGAAYPE